MSTNTETSGGTRYAEGKVGGFWYLPIKGLRLVAQVATMGAGKYAPRDWANGQSFSTLLDCTMRHLMAVLESGNPWLRDSESGFYHLAHACWNVLCLLTFLAEGRVDLDDVSVWDGVTAAQFKRANEIAGEKGIGVVESLKELGYVPAPMRTPTPVEPVKIEVRLGDRPHEEES